MRAQCLATICCCILLIITIDVWSQEHETVEKLLTAARAHEDLHPDSAVNYCSIAMRLAEAHRNLGEQASVLLELARISRLHHHTEVAGKFVNDAMNLFHQLHDEEGLARTYEELGILDGQRQKTATAIKDFTRALSYYTGKADTAGIAQTYYDEGTTYENKGDLETALDYYLRARHYYEQYDTKPAAYFTLLERISNVQVKKGNVSSAIGYLEEGIRNGKERPDTEMRLLEEEGRIREHAAEHARALELFKKELQLARQWKNPETQARALTAIGSVLMAQQTDSSLTYLKQALAIAQRLPHPELLANIYEAMASVYRQQRNYKDAMLALSENSRLLDSLLVSKANSEIAAQDSSYVIESREEELSQLREKNRVENEEIYWGLIALGIVIGALVLLGIYLRKVKLLNKKLAKSNEIHDTLFSVIGHDLKGPAGNTVQLLDLIQSGQLPETLQKDMLTQLRQQAAASRDLLEDLFTWGKAQLYGVEIKPNVFEIKPLVQNTIQLLSRQAAGKQITITDQTPAHLAVYADAHQVEFIFRNLISNAIKFTYTGGIIEVNASVINETAVCAVKDNGVGISKEKQHAFLKTTLPVSFGTNGEKGSGLGLLLIKEFLTANKGQLWLESEPGKGTIFYFSLPIPGRN